MLAKKFLNGLLLAGLAFLSGCATTQVAIDATAEIPDYAQTIYLITPSPGGDPRNVYPRVLAGLRERGFRVEVVNPDSPLLGRQGTAFAISEEGHFLTSAHLFEKETEASLWLAGERFEATVLKKNPETDLALLRLKELPPVPLTALPMAAEPAYRLGADVFTIGFPLSDILGRQPRLNKGLVSASVGMRDDPAFMQVTVETQPGNSGSPVFNAQREVIGLMQSTLNTATTMRATGGAAPQNVNFALKLPAIQTFLQDVDLTLPRARPEEEQPDFETLSRSVAQVRSGIVTDEMLDSDKLICVVVYHSRWDMWRRFSLFQIILLDFHTRDIVLAAGQTGDNPFSTETATIEGALDEVQRKLLPAP
jgi:serine protease Do